MAPLTRRRKRALAAAPPPPPPVIDPADRLSRLPEDILAQILSFLPAQDAMRTCVLARTWRHVSKFSRRLLITGNSGYEVQEFVNNLLSLRLEGLKCAPLDACELMFDPFENFEEDEELEDYDLDEKSLNKWIHRVLKCQIKMLRVHICTTRWYTAYLSIGNRPLVSQYLTRLELSGVWTNWMGDIHYHLNLSGCPALEHLKITNSLFVGLRKITSPSLKRLVITSCKSNEDFERLKICVPSLVSLWLEFEKLRAPLLGSMPELVEAYVRNDSIIDHVIQASYISDTEDDSAVILEGLAQAKDLVLLAKYRMCIFGRDLRWCPTFSKLKTLVLNDYWCEPADCRALACILQHAPVLEKLTVLICRKVKLKYDIVLEGRLDPSGKSTMILQHLKIVEVKCYVLNDRVQNVLKFLSALNIWFKFRATEGSN